MGSGAHRQTLADNATWAARTCTLDRKSDEDFSRIFMGDNKAYGRWKGSAAGERDCQAWWLKLERCCAEQGVLLCSDAFRGPHMPLAAAALDLCPPLHLQKIHRTPHWQSGTFTTFTLRILEITPPEPLLQAYPG